MTPKGGRTPTAKSFQASRAIADNYAAIETDEPSVVLAAAVNLFQRDQSGALHQGCETWMWEDPRQ